MKRYGDDPTLCAYHPLVELENGEWVKYVDFAGVANATMALQILLRTVLNTLESDVAPSWKVKALRELLDNEKVKKAIGDA